MTNDELQTGVVGLYKLHEVMSKNIHELYKVTAATAENMEHLSGHMNQLIDRMDQLTDRMDQSTVRMNELTLRVNEVASVVQQLHDIVFKGLDSKNGHSNN